MPSRYDLEPDELAELLAPEPAYRARQLFDGLHRQLRGPEEMTDLPAALRSRVAELLPPGLAEQARSRADDGETTKWAWRLEDGVIVETVLMEYEERVTVCVSTQAGCAMACSFCATGQGGFRRHLTKGEVVEQVVRAAQAAAPRRVSNIVFMGMGEPLSNYDVTMGAVRRLHGAMGISARKLTISTVGIVPGIRRLAAEELPVNLAVSLHAADDVTRDRLVPINKRYPLGLLADACAEYVDATHRRLSFEWALISGENDRDRDVELLAAFARPLAAHVNLIPLNPTPGYLVRGSTPERVAAFAKALDELGVTTTVRSTRGREIDAACGQLAGPSKVEIRR